MSTDSRDSSASGFSRPSRARRTIGPMPTTRTPARLAGRSRAVVAAVALLGLALAGCASDAPQDTLKPEGSQAHKIADLYFVYWIAIAVAAIVGIMVVVVLVRFRQRDDDRVPAQVHGNTRLEIAWTAAPAFLLLIIAVPTISTIFKLAEKPKDAVDITVIGQQWWWEYDYPAEGIVTANEMVIPAGRPTYLSITSRDVIHSFWIPRLNGKKDAVPGRVHKLTMEADKPGVYWGQCAEFCGLSHANMRMRVRALSEADWKVWVASQKEPAAAPATDAAQRGLTLFTQRCVSCHQVNGVNVADASDYLIAGAAPNLTHFASRSIFAGGTLELYQDGDTSKPLNRPGLEQWLRDPNSVKPMAADEKRGMPNLNLTEAQIDDLVEYLSGLK